MLPTPPIASGIVHDIAVVVRPINHGQDVRLSPVGSIPVRNRDHKVKGRCSRIQMDEVLNSGFDGMHKWSPMERSEHLMVARSSKTRPSNGIRDIGNEEDSANQEHVHIVTLGQIWKASNSVADKALTGEGGRRNWGEGAKPPTERYESMPARDYATSTHVGL